MYLAKYSALDIAESPVQFEYRLHRSVEFGEPGTGTLLGVGEIVLDH